MGVGTLSGPTADQRRLAPGSRPGIPVGFAIALADRALRQIGRRDAFALSDLGDISLPPVVGDPADQDLLRFVAPLYLASELESAGLLEALDTIARLFASGGIRRDLGRAVGPLTRVWRTRNRRFSAEERRAIHRRLFGAAGPTALAGARANDEFEPTFA